MNKPTLMGLGPRAAAVAIARAGSDALCSGATRATSSGAFLALYRPELGGSWADGKARAPYLIETGKTSARTPGGARTRASPRIGGLRAQADFRQQTGK
jgi:hypothetical protein